MRINQYVVYTSPVKIVNDFTEACKIADDYFNVISFLDDDELHQVWDICAEAMERKGWDVDNSELSIRAYDDNLRQNVDADDVCEPEPCGTTHPYYYEY